MVTHHSASDALHLVSFVRPPLPPPGISWKHPCPLLALSGGHRAALRTKEMEQVKALRFRRGFRVRIQQTLACTPPHHEINELT